MQVTDLPTKFSEGNVDADDSRAIGENKRRPLHALYVIKGTSDDDVSDSMFRLEKLDEPGDIHALPNGKHDVDHVTKQHSDNGCHVTSPTEAHIDVKSRQFRLFVHNESCGCC